MFFFFFVNMQLIFFFFFSSRRRHTRSLCDWSSDVWSSDLDVAVEPELLPVVLADVRVVPVQAGVGERDAAREAAADLDRRLGLVGAVGPVVEAQAVPVDRRLEVALVDDLDVDLGPL